MTRKAYAVHLEIGVRGGLRAMSTPGEDIPWQPPAPVGWTPGVVKPGTVGGETGLAVTGAARLGARTHNGSVVLTTGGTKGNPRIIENFDILGRFQVRAPYITFRNGYGQWDGEAYTGTTGIIDCQHPNAYGITIENVELNGLSPDGQATKYLDGIVGHDYLSRRCNVHHVIDGMGVYNNNSGAQAGATNVFDEGSWFHDLTYKSPDDTHGDKRSHNDGCQVQGGTGTYLWGTRLDCLVAPQGEGSDLANNGLTGWVGNPYAPSATGQAFGVTPNVSFSTARLNQCWLDGGAQSVTVIAKRASGGGAFGAIVYGASLTMTNCIFERSHIPTVRRYDESKTGVLAQRAVLIEPDLGHIEGFPDVTGPDISGNVWADTGLPITIHRHYGTYP